METQEKNEGHLTALLQDLLSSKPEQRQEAELKLTGLRSLPGILAAFLTFACTGEFPKTLPSLDDHDDYFDDLRAAGESFNLNYLTGDLETKSADFVDTFMAFEPNDVMAQRVLSAVIAKGIVNHHWCSLKPREVADVEALLLAHLINVPSPVRKTIHVIAAIVASKGTWADFTPTVRHLLSRGLLENRHHDVIALLELLLVAATSPLVAKSILTELQEGLLALVRGMRQYNIEKKRQVRTVVPECRRKCLELYRLCVATAKPETLLAVVVPLFDEWMTAIQDLVQEISEEHTDLESHRMAVTALTCLESLLPTDTHASDDGGPSTYLESYYCLTPSETLTTITEREEPAATATGSSDQQDEVLKRRYIYDQVLLSKMQRSLSITLETCVSLLKSYYPVYQSMVIEESAVFEESEEGGPLALVCHLCSLLIACLRSAVLRCQLLQDRVAGSIDCLLRFATITDFQQDLWGRDVPEFVMTEYDDTPQLDLSSPRRALRRLIESLLTYLPSESLQCLLAFLLSEVSKDDAKSCELGLWVACLIGRSNRSNQQFDNITGLLQRIGCIVYQGDSPTFLRARALLCAADLRSIVIRQFPHDVSRLAMLASNLLVDRLSPPLIQLAAAIALTAFIPHQESEDVFLIKQSLINAVDRLTEKVPRLDCCCFEEAINTSDIRHISDNQSMVLEAVLCALKQQVLYFPAIAERCPRCAHGRSSNEAASCLVEILVECWTRQDYQVPRVVHAVQDLIKVSCRVSGVLKERVRQHLVPVLLTTVERAIRDSSDVESHLLSSALSLIELILRSLTYSSNFSVNDQEMWRTTTRHILLLLLSNEEPSVVASGVSAILAALDAARSHPSRLIDSIVEDVAVVLEKLLEIDLQPQYLSPITQLLLSLLEDFYLGNEAIKLSVDLSSRLLSSALRRATRTGEDQLQFLIAVSRFLVTGGEAAFQLLGLIMGGTTPLNLAQAWGWALTADGNKKSPSRLVIIEATYRFILISEVLFPEMTELVAANLLRILLLQYKSADHGGSEKRLLNVRLVQLLEHFTVKGAPWLNGIIAGSPTEMQELTNSALEARRDAAQMLR